MLSIVLPCFNAASTIDASLHKLVTFLSSTERTFEIITVDDGSTDTTSLVLREWASRDARVQPVFLSPNHGKGTAVKAGVLQSQGDIVMFTDADLPYDLSAIEDAKKAITAGAQVVLGSRFKPEEVVLEQKGHRTLLSRVFLLFANTVLLSPVPDTQAGFKAFEGDVARRLFAEVTLARFGFDVEVILLAQQLRLRIVSIPVRLIQQGVSTVRLFRDGCAMCRDLLYLFVRKYNWISWKTLTQFMSYGIVGIANTALNFVILNIFIYLTGFTRGIGFLGISFLSFCIVVFHSFIWNRYLVFRRQNPREVHREYIAFFAVTSMTMLLNLSVLHLIVNIIGAPEGVSAHLWANIALLITIPLSVLCNFVGYKFLVFAER